MNITDKIIAERIRDFIKAISDTNFNIYDVDDYYNNKDITEIIWMTWVHKDRCSGDFLYKSPEQINPEFFIFLKNTFLNGIKVQLDDKICELLKYYYLDIIMKIVQKYYESYLEGIWE